MDYGDLYAGLNALDAVRVVRNSDGSYSHMIFDDEIIPVADTPAVTAFMYVELYPTPSVVAPEAGATGVTLGPTLVSREGVSRVYTVGTRDTSNQTGVVLNTDLIFNQPSDSDVPLDITTGVFTLRAGVEYELIASPNLSNFTSPTLGYANFRWVFADDNLPIPNGAAGSVVPLRDISGKSFQPVALATYRPVVDTSVKVRVFESGSGSCSLVAGTSWSRVSATSQRTIDYTAASSEFQVRRLLDQGLVFSSGAVPGLTASVTPALAAGTQYQVRVRHSDNVFPNWTGWSPWQDFTTA